jgi:hypothetical protein
MYSFSIAGFAVLFVLNKSNDKAKFWFGLIIFCDLFAFSQIYVPTNPRGAESLPPGIVVSQSELYLRRLWGEPSEVWCTMVVRILSKNIK